MNVEPLYYYNGEYITASTLKWYAEKQQDYEKETSYEAYLESLELENECFYDLDDDLEDDYDSMGLIKLNDTEEF